MRILDPIYRFRVARTHEIADSDLRALWHYWKDGEPYSVRAALAFARKHFADNPEAEIQIAEGHAQLAALLKCAHCDDVPTQEICGERVCDECADMFAEEAAQDDTERRAALSRGQP